MPDRHSSFPIQQTRRNPAYGSSGALLLTRKIKACCRNTRLSSATHKPLLPLSCCRVTPTSSSGRHSQLYCCCVLCGWDRLSLNCRACLWTRAPDSHVESSSSTVTAPPSLSLSFPVLPKALLLLTGGDQCENSPLLHHCLIEIPEVWITIPDDSSLKKYWPLKELPSCC